MNKSQKENISLEKTIVEAFLGNCEGVTTKGLPALNQPTRPLISVYDDGSVDVRCRCFREGKCFAQWAYRHKRPACFYYHS